MPNETSMEAALRIALKELGVQETSGPKATKRIMEYHAATSGGMPPQGDETSWCASFACWVLQQAGLTHPRSKSARSFLDWGSVVSEPRAGCITVLKRDDPKNPNAGHVGLWIGAGAGQVFLLGGNQGNAVSIRPYALDRVLGCRWLSAPLSAP